MRVDRAIGEIHRILIAPLRLDWSCCHSGAIVGLRPKRPPGRADRKAAAHASEIVQLRAEGYTREAIREALTEFGIGGQDHCGPASAGRSHSRLPGRGGRGHERFWRTPYVLTPLVGE